VYFPRRTIVTRTLPGTLLLTTTYLFIDIFKKERFVMDTKRKNTDSKGDISPKKARVGGDGGVIDEDETAQVSKWERPKPPPIDPNTYALGEIQLNAPCYLI
jgi:hypothetical protein